MCIGVALRIILDACLASGQICFELAGGILDAKGRYFAYGLRLNATVVAEVIALLGDLVGRLSDSETWWA